MMQGSDLFWTVLGGILLLALGIFMFFRPDLVCEAHRTVEILPGRRAVRPIPRLDQGGRRGICPGRARRSASAVYPKINKVRPCL